MNEVVPMSMGDAEWIRDNLGIEPDGSNLPSE